MRRGWIVCCCAVMSCVAVAAPAAAQPSPSGPAAPEAKDEARELANKGFERFQAGHYKEALELLRAADAKFHAPTILLMVARAHEKLGQLVEADAVYSAIVGEALPPGAPREFVDAQQTAKDEQAKVKARIPTVEVVVSGAQPGQVEITLDGAPIAPSAPQPRDPGEHTVTVRAEGGAGVTQTVSLREGAHERMAIDLSALAAPPGAGDGAPPDAGTPSQKGSLLPAVVAFGVGGAGLAVGAVTGLLELGKVGSLEDGCSANKQCGPDLQSDYDTAHTLATVSTVGFVIGGLGVAAGAVLLFVRPGGGDAGRDGVSAGLVVGPGWIGARGSF